MEFVVRHLLPTILESTQLEQLAKDLVAENGKSITRSQRTRQNHVEEQINQLITDVFDRVDREVYELVLDRVLHQQTQLGLEAQQRRSEAWLASGCSAILALLVGPHLFVANCGSQMAIFCKDGSDGISTISLNECHDREQRCFGNYERKTRDPECQPLPTLQPRIELNPDARFLLLAPQPVWRLFQRVCPENQSLDGAVASAVAEAIYGPGDSTPREKLAALLAQLQAGELADGQPVQIATAGTSMALVNLGLGLFPKVVMENEEEAELPEEEAVDQHQGETVKSAVDWSEFATHHLKEEVLAKVDSLRQLYRDRRTLQRISEDL